MHIGELSGLTYVHLPDCCTDISSVGDSGILCCLTLTVWPGCLKAILLKMVKNPYKSCEKLL